MDTVIREYDSRVRGRGVLTPDWSRDVCGNGLAAVSGFGSLAPAIAVIGWFLLAPIFLFRGEEIATAVFEEREPETAPREPKRED